MSDLKKVLGSKRAPIGAVTQKHTIMKDLLNIKNVADLTIGETYIDGGSAYYVAKCKSIDLEVTNNGFNAYFQSAVFDIYSISGRLVATVNRTFLHPTLNN